MYYVYFYLRENGTPYYIGKGKDYRAYVSRHRVARPEDRNRILIQDFLSEADAFEAEKFFIAFYGRADLGTGCLRNLTDGGEQPPSRKGVSPSVEHRLKISKTLSGKTFSDDKVRCRRMGDAHIGLQCSEETRKKIRNAQINKVRPQTLGSCNGNSSLTENDVLIIRDAYNNDGATYAELAQMFNVSKVTIGSVINRHTWATI